MLARDIMNREIVPVRRGSSLATAARLMLEHGINSLPVLDQAGRMVGMIGIRDVLRVPVPSGSEMPLLKWIPPEEKAHRLLDTTVDQVMARRVVSVDESATVMEVAALMANKGVHPIPVLRGDKLLGVVGRADVVRALLDVAERERIGVQSESA
jgi:CBS domain-containing protein